MDKALKDLTKEDLQQTPGLGGGYKMLTYIPDQQGTPGDRKV